MRINDKKNKIYREGEIKIHIEDERKKETLHWESSQKQMQ